MRQMDVSELSSSELKQVRLDRLNELYSVLTDIYSLQGNVAMNRAYLDGVPVTKIAKWFDVSPQVIRKVLNKFKNTDD